MKTQTEISDHQLVITRIFDAPRQLVWEAWTQPEHISQWWGPQGFQTKVLKMEFKPGGEWRYVMTSPKGDEYPVIGRFEEIHAPEKIVSVDDFGEEYKAIMDASKLPQKVTTTALFEEVEGKTRLTLIMTHLTEEDKIKHEKMGAIHGWNASLDNLIMYLQKLV